jgi:mono/diheme cytochrome c family protein
LYLAETNVGKVWRVMFKGDKEHFGEKELIAMEERKNASNIRTPDAVKDDLTPEDVSEGQRIYSIYCAICHQNDGQGAGTRYPPLAGTDWVSGDKERLIKVILHGLEGEVEINGTIFNSMMPQHSFLSDNEIAGLLTYIRSSFGNNAAPVEASEVKLVRAQN